MRINTWKCPNCACYATRIHRRLIDRALSMLIPVHRYKCHNYLCQWQGNVRQGLCQQPDTNT